MPETGRGARRRPRRLARALLGIAGALTLLGAGAYACSDEDADDVAQPVDGAVSAGTREATQAGLEMLARGGNAVDAAVAASLALGVTEPAASGLGGAGVLLLRTAEGNTLVIRAASDSLAAGGAPAPSLLQVLHHAWTRYGSGRIPWSDVVAPAILAARDGYPIGGYSQTAIVQSYGRLLDDDGASALLLASDRSITAEASRVRNPDLATTLEAIAAEGPDALYTGALAESLSRTLQGRGLGEALASVQVTEERASSGAYRDATVWTPSGREGAFVLDALRFLEQAPPEELAFPGSARAVLLSEALAFGWAAQSAQLDVAVYMDALPPLPEPAEGAVAPSGAPRAPARPPERAGAPAGPRSSRIDPRALADQAGHVSVVDARGNAVSLTQTLGVPFGSGFVVPGLGFFYMDPRAVRTSTWAVPAIVTRSDRIELVLGSGGGERALSAVLEVLARYLDGGEPLDAAVLAPRIHVAPARGNERGTIYLEGAVWTDSLSVREGAYPTWGWGIDRVVAERGFTLGERDAGPRIHGLDPWFGGVNAIAWSSDGWSAIGDERRDGAGGVVKGGVPSLQFGPVGVTTPPEVRAPASPRDP